MNAETHQKFLAICREAGWKCTSQRLAVYEFIFGGNPKHLEVDDVWRIVRKRLPSITRESIYRILNEFSEKGIIRRIDHIERARYDPRTNPHGHFICKECGTIFDFDLQGDGFPQVNVPGKVHYQEFLMVGICEACINHKAATAMKGKAAQPDVQSG